MVVCPHCRLENPDNNKFCQGCGTSLSHQDCPHCGASVAFGEETCDSCGGSVGIVLWATIAEKIKTEPETEETQEELPLMGAKGISYSEFSLAIEDLNQQQENREKLQRQIISFPDVGEFLDAERRYQLKFKKDEEIARIFESQDSFCLVEGRVLDCQPLQQFHLKRIQQQRPELFKELYQSCSKNYLSFFQYWNLVGVPTFALPYLSLQQFTPIVPEIYDAWQNRDRGIVLLPDRSSWQTITELCQTHDLSPLAVSWLLSEMAKLWTPLCAIGCAESLLVTDNLRVDEDRCFALQKLYLDSPNREYTLKDLVRVWQALLCEQTRYESLDRLLNKVINGEIEMVKELRSELENLSTEEQLKIERESPSNEIPPDNIHTTPANDLVETNLIDLETEQNLDREIEEEIEAEMDTFSESDNWENIASDFDFEEFENPTEDPTVVLSLGLANFADAGCTDIGSHRDHNEDCFGMETELKKQQSDRGKTIKVKGLYVVCDGMGGHEAGEVASAMAVKTLQDYFHTHWQHTLPDEQTIREGVLLANQALYKINLDNARSGHSRMGTTMVMVLLQDDKFAIAHVGDSRIYRITQSQGLEKLTTDHEVGQREILRGVEPQIAYARPDAYQLTQALGPRNDNFVKPEIQFFEVQEDSILLLCSDGLSDNDFIEKYWETKIFPLIDASMNLDEGLANVIDFANHYSGHDNITGVAVRVNLRPNTEK
jgi:protein phosphatase